jgi:hypothetical protein
MRRHDQPAAQFHPCLQPFLALLALFEEAGILDGHTGGSGQGHGKVLILRGEVLPAVLFRQVEVSIHFVADSDRHSKEGVHRWMVGWKA